MHRKTEKIWIDTSSIMSFEFSKLMHVISDAGENMRIYVPAKAIKELKDHKNGNDSRKRTYAKRGLDILNKYRAEGIVCVDRWEGMQLLFLGTQDYSRLKLRTLLRAYGYQRRSEKLVQNFHDNLLFYHIETYVRGGVQCDISEIGLDEMITFRICG